MRTFDVVELVAVLTSAQMTGMACGCLLLWVLR